MKRIFFLSVSIIIMVSFFYWQNNALVITKHVINSDKIPKGFNHYKILHLSDLHNKNFGKRQEKLVGRIKKEKPDVIVFTGDIIDRRSKDLKPAALLIDQLVELAPVYFVPGNHEWDSDLKRKLETLLMNKGVVILTNKVRIIERNGERIEMAGLDDPESGLSIRSSIKRISEKMQPDLYSIVLSHRPTWFNTYTRAGFNLVFSGHAHGGQIRLPIIGGVFAPGEGLNPKYSEGIHQQDHTSMVVSRGLGNSSFPLRIFNRPEIVVITLQSE
ncbi:metallophosphoesterase [Neobacillus niacini]|uniref:metallophosphoesterase n=1 Tax=Neobacillus niacini TaxID=86668 RepID=UPI003B01BE44